MREKVDIRYKYYLSDLGYLLKEDALKAKQERDALTRDTQEHTFAEGYLMGLK
jgi:hypothetical protein